MKPMHIMTVDDDPLMLDLLATYFFRCQQSRTYQALDAETALKELNRKPYDVVLTDINRPGMDGLTFTRWVCRLGGPPVIVLTGYYHPLCRKQAFASGAMACLAKPVRLPLLAEVIELVVDRGVRFIGTGREKKQRIFFPEKNEKIQR